MALKLFTHQVLSSGISGSEVVGGDMEGAETSSHLEVHRSDKNVETLWRILVILN
jgi:hypothetical protein